MSVIFLYAIVLKYLASFLLVNLICKWLTEGKQILNEMETIRQKFITETDNLTKYETEEFEDSLSEEKTESGAEREVETKRKEKLEVVR